MRKILFFITIIILSSNICFAGTTTSTTPQQNPSEFTARDWKKIAPDLQNAWLASKKSGDMSTKFICFIRIREPISMGDKDFLESNGAELIGAATFFSAISKAKIAPSNLPSIADLDFVQRISLAKEQ